MRLALRTRYGCLENQPSTICNWRAPATALRQLILHANTLATCFHQEIHSPPKKNVVGGRCRWCSWNPRPSRLAVPQTC